MINIIMGILVGIFLVTTTWVVIGSYYNRRF